MAKEIRIYGTFDDYFADYFMEQLEAANNQDVIARINTNGGDPLSGFGMVAKWSEFPGKRHCKIDAKAYSTGAFFVCYSHYSEALDVSEFLFHRAAYPSWYEKSEYMTDTEWKSLDRVNKFLRAALEAKVNVKLFEKITKVTLDELFSNKTRIDVRLTSEEALQIGLINKINPITPEISAEIETYSLEMAAKYNAVAKQPQAKSNNGKNHKKVMTSDEIKTQHPSVYAQIVAEGKTAGLTEERERIRGWEAYRNIDAEAVNKGIASGKPISVADMAEFQAKALSSDFLQKLTASAAPILTTTTPPATAETEEQKAMASFESEVFQHLGIKKIIHKKGETENE
jgi:ATP-dependent protease ClpP protease subunit